MMALVSYRLRGSDARSQHLIRLDRARVVVETLLVNRLVEWIALDDGTQVCATCGVRKGGAAFYSHPGARNRRHYECKACFDARRARNRERRGRR